MTIQDQVILALTIWRENRGGGFVGMQSVANVIVNRARKHNSSAYVECTRRLQFSSMTAPNDPELSLWPAAIDTQWQVALGIAATAAAGTLQDITGGADLYYAPAGIRGDVKITLPGEIGIQPFPAGWNPQAVEFTGAIAKQFFFRSR